MHGDGTTVANARCAKVCAPGECGLTPHRQTKTHEEIFHHHVRRSAQDVPPCRPENPRRRRCGDRRLAAVAAARFCGRQAGRRRDLRRSQGRLRLQPGAGAGGGRDQEDARRHRGRAGEGGRDHRRAEGDGLDDRAGRRDADLSHLVRLLRSAHAEDGGEVSERALRPLRRAVDRGQASEEHRQLFRLYRRVPVPERRGGRLCDQEQEARVHRRQADSAGPAQHQRLHAWCAEREARHHHSGDLHRRLAAAGEGGGGRQQPDRPGRGRADDARGQPESDRGDRRAARHLRVRLSRRPIGARAQGLSHRCGVELAHALHARTSRKLWPASR